MGQNFDLVNLVEECLAKNLHYERLLHKNGIDFDKLHITADKHSRAVDDPALIKYTD